MNVLKDMQLIDECLGAISHPCSLLQYKMWYAEIIYNIVIQLEFYKDSKK